MDEHRHIDDALANQTDALLGGQPLAENLEAEPELQELSLVVRQLRDVIKPEQAPPPEFETRLRQRLDQEFNQQRVPRSRARFISTPARLNALAAALFIFLVVAALLVAPNVANLIEGAVATASEVFGLLLGVGILVVIIICVYWYWRSRR